MEFEHLAADNFTTIPQDALWVACMVYLAEVCTFLGDARRAATLYQCLTTLRRSQHRGWSHRGLRTVLRRAISVCSLPPCHAGRTHSTTSKTLLP